MSITLKDSKWLNFCIDGAELFSTCAKRKYFSVIVDKYDHLIGSGWNGVPKKMQHCNEGGCPRLADNSEPGSSYNNCIAIHSEANALLHSDYTARRSGATIYVNGSPCWDCAKLMANSGVSRIVHLEDDNRDNANVRVFLLQAGITVDSCKRDELFSSEL